MDDPFDAVLSPPVDESPEDMKIRIAREEEARRVSQAIDASIKAERQQRKKRRIVRLLLLGQSESGKSTTLRQFQRLYTPSAFREERILWRAVIQLNLVRSIRTILDAIASPQRSASYPRSLGCRTKKSQRHLTFHDVIDPQLYPAQSHVLDENQASSSTRRLEDIPPPRNSEDNNDAHSSEDCHDNSPYDSPTEGSHLPPELEALKVRLLPIRHIEALLIAKLVPPNEEEPAHMGKGTNVGSEIGSSWRNEEVFVRPGRGRRGLVGRSGQYDADGIARKWTLEEVQNVETSDQPQAVLQACSRDIKRLWEDPNVRSILRRKKIRLEEFPGFFLDDVDRVTSLRYIPTDDDVLKARLKTVGVSEYRFELEIAGKDSGPEWRIVDVGGSRSQRPTWIPFFDNVDAIIFLAPISGFDQVLVEDRSVNRLEDSVILWKAVCSNKLLANVELVLFLNKCDILDAKLRSGVNIAKYMKSYGDRGNDVESVSKYLKTKFSGIHREVSPIPRKLYAFCTSVTDTTTTAGILASVKDMVVRQNLRQSKML